MLMTIKMEPAIISGLFADFLVGFPLFRRKTSLTYYNFRVISKIFSSFRGLFVKTGLNLLKFPGYFEKIIVVAVNGNKKVFIPRISL